MGKIIWLWLTISLSLMGSSLTIQKSSPESLSNRPIKIAIVSAPSIIGKYTQSIYNVSLATLMGLHQENFSLIRYDLKDESEQSLEETLAKAQNEGMEAIIAPLTSTGAKNLLTQKITLPIFIPTVHKRDFPNAPDNMVFGAIDYRAQIEILLPYMSESISVFYDSSTVGMQLKSMTEEIFSKHKSDKKKVSSYPIDIKGDNIVKHLSKPALFSKSSIIIHLPVVKSSMLSAHMTFTGVKERNILSTQINVDPTLITLTQPNDRNNMILANSIIEFPDSILQANDLMHNDITYDWIHYTTCVGIDYLYSVLSNHSRTFTMRIIHSQVIYPIELVKPKDSGFIPL